LWVDSNILLSVVWLLYYCRKIDKSHVFSDSTTHPSQHLLLVMDWVGSPSLHTQVFFQKQIPKMMKVSINTTFQWGFSVQLKTQNCFFYLALLWDYNMMNEQIFIQDCLACASSNCKLHILQSTECICCWLPEKYELH
jgi:hypothetical protein